MVDWSNFVRKNLPPLRLESEREMEMVEELAQHLESVYEEALSFDASSQEALLLTGFAGLAAYLPARRASQVDPMVALRHE